MSQSERGEIPPKLYIRKFPFDMSREEMIKYFEQFGPIREIDFKNSTGFLEYENYEAFDACLNTKHIFSGNEVFVDTGYNNFNREQPPNRNSNYNTFIPETRDNCKVCSNCPQHGIKSQIRKKSDTLKLVLENIPPVENKREIDAFLENNFGYNIPYSQLVKDNTMYIAEFVEFSQKQDALHKLRGVNFKGNELTVRIYIPPKESFSNRTSRGDYQDRSSGSSNFRGGGNRGQYADRSGGVDLYSDVNKTDQV
ncbi:putative splicing factor [Cucumispora dikerogammari]|nr:putative splicing factor [Cucumispora dikerogammari]